MHGIKVTSPADTNVQARIAPKMTTDSAATAGAQPFSTKRLHRRTALFYEAVGLSASMMSLRPLQPWFDKIWQPGEIELVK
jgi:hypothetical protein